MILANALATYCLLMDGHKDEAVCSGFRDGTFGLVLLIVVIALVVVSFIAGRER